MVTSKKGLLLGFLFNFYDIRTFMRFKYIVYRSILYNEHNIHIMFKPVNVVALAIIGCEYRAASGAWVSVVVVG